ncbi:MAG: IS1595 family transposase [Gemmatimonadaceae bacterium]
MITPYKLPESLSEAVRYFADVDRAFTFMAHLRWPDGTRCVHCDADKPIFLSTRRIWKCRSCRKQFSVKLGTIFEDSALGLDKWLPALWLIANCKNGVSSYEVARALKVTQKSAWFMLHRIRTAMRAKSFGKWEGGEFEVDESFIGGKAGNMHPAKKKRVLAHPQKAKAAIVGILRRGPNGTSRVRAAVTPKVTKPVLQQYVREHIEAGSAVYTDAYLSYKGLDRDYIHDTIDHGVAYVRGNAHTQGLENFWSLLKRAIKGTYVSVDPFHLRRYVDAQAFRFNARAANDGQRFIEVVKGIIGRRITYKQLIGADISPATT